MADDRAVLTIATGKRLYVDLAINLARSFFHWHDDDGIIFQLVTDRPELIPPDIRDKIELIQIKPGELGVGFTPKLHLDKLVTHAQTLFIDSDCLLFENIGWLFDRLKGHPVSVVGGYISDGEWFGDMKSICRQFNIPHMPKFNGGLYYLEKGKTASAVYETARELEGRYDDIGFVRLRGRPNDEVLMAMAMQLNNQQPIPDDGTIMSDPQACPGGYKIDVISGKRWLLNPPKPHPRHQDWYPFQKVSPAIVHFLGSYTLDYPYKTEAFRLMKLSTASLNILANITAALTIKLPGALRESTKNLLRPLYHKFFGPRKINQSERVV